MDIEPALRAIAAEVDTAPNVSEAGALNRVVFAEVNNMGVAVKVPRRVVAPEVIMREVSALEACDEHRSDLCVRMPELVGYSTAETSQYIAYKYMPGDALPLSATQHLTELEQQALGGGMAVAVAELGAITIDTYPELATPPREPSVPWWRYSMLEEAVTERRTQNKLWPPLEQACDNIFAYAETAKANEPAASTFGHGDLRPDNMLFTEDALRFSMRSVIDFGFSGPSYPEYELRYVPFISGYTFDRAITTYELATNATLDQELLLFWSGAQIALMASRSMARTGGVPVEQMHALQNVFPAIDFDA